MIVYEYYDAVRPDGTLKPGCNRITYEVDENNVKTETFREYLPGGKPSIDDTLLDSLTDEQLLKIKERLSKI